MTIYSSSDLATRVLRDLSLYGPDEPIDASDLADVQEIINSEIPGMAARGIPVWNGSEAHIPQEYLSALSRRLGLAVGPSHGVFTMAEAIIAIEPAERYLRQLSAKPATGSVAEAEYF